jgi:hypothetical protein
VTTALRRIAILCLVAVLPGTAAPQAAGTWSCRTDSLATFNCAPYYSGTVTLTSELKGPGFTQTLSIVATVTAGRVMCTVKDSEVGDFEGPGMLAVPHETNANAGEYDIDVWCPEAPGERPTRDDSPMIQVMKQRATNYGTLEGRDEHENPSVDPVNQVSGTETITWRLRRS